MTSTPLANYSQKGYRIEINDNKTPTIDENYLLSHDGEKAQTPTNAPGDKQHFTMPFENVILDPQISAFTKIKMRSNKKKGKT